MTFNNLIDQLKKLNLPADQYVVVGSGALASLGIREAHDFDVLVTWNLWNKLRKTYPLTKTQPVENIDIDDIQILGHGSPFRIDNIATVDEIIKTANVVDGIKFININLLRKFKLNEGREKDLNDVKLIDVYLSQDSSNK